MHEGRSQNGKKNGKFQLFNSGNQALIARDRRSCQSAGENIIGGIAAKNLE
jgi:hypothetical protein